MKSFVSCRRKLASICSAISLYGKRCSLLPKKFLLCHPREGGDPGKVALRLVPRFRGDDKGESFWKTVILRGDDKRESLHEKMLKPCILLLALMLTSCTSMNEASRKYFAQGHKFSGVESPNVVIDKLNNHDRMRKILYKNISKTEIISCTFLRNQLYIAALGNLNGQDGKDIRQAAITIEQGYQQDDQAFLHACREVLASRVGVSFKKTQEQILLPRY